MKFGWYAYMYILVSFSCGFGMYTKKLITLCSCMIQFLELMFVWVMADAFSMFDYGGSMGLVGLVSWCSVAFIYLVLMMGLDLWVVGNRFTFMLNSVSTVFGRQVLGGSQVIYGFGLFCVGLFVYLCFVGVYSISPYVFCLTAQFSHNFCIAMVLWFSTLLLNLTISIKGFFMHFVPSGLSWWQAAPVGLFEMVSNLSRLITLGARLTMNMIAGKLLLCVGSAFWGAMAVNGSALGLGGICFLLLILALTGWEMVVGIVQAYIFTFLSVTYINEAPIYMEGH
uniref:ATP synthase subunit a n=1 Tax=Solecurtus divaricatus TaxID=444102 RepID=I6NIN8_9BIVA|nr:ATP synthase F0 subunit 6 [Solecurtus divaricatus]AEV94336.1 ATPase subunit 6 [Solecurtus divaricatus]